MSDFLKHIYTVMDDKQAQDIVILDFINHSPFVDYFIIADARNERMAQAIVDAVEDAAHEVGHEVLYVDKKIGSKWLLIDLGEIVVHIFFDGERYHYDLEGLWKDLGTIKM